VADAADEGTDTVVSARRSILLLCAGLVATLTAPRLVAEDGQVSLDERVKTLLTAISYHKSKGMREPGPFVIALVSDPQAHKEVIERAHQAFSHHKNLKIGRKPFKLVHLPYEDAKSFRAALQKDSVDAVYIAAESRRITRQVLNITREVKILSITAVADYVHRLGASLGVEARAGKPKLLINLSSCKNEGVEFDARLLRLASVYF